MTTPSWPLNFLMVRPVLTSHRKTCLSPPQEANLQRASMMEDGESQKDIQPELLVDILRSQTGYTCLLSGN